MAMTDGPDRSNDHPDGDRPASEGDQEKAIFVCQDCDTANPEIEASHNYSIRYDSEQGKYVKDEGNVQYGCSQCHTDLDIHDMEDILKSVDEL